MPSSLLKKPTRLVYPDFGTPYRIRIDDGLMKSLLLGSMLMFIYSSVVALIICCYGNFISYIPSDTRRASAHDATAYDAAHGAAVYDAAAQRGHCA